MEYKSKTPFIFSKTATIQQVCKIDQIRVILNDAYFANSVQKQMFFQQTPKQKLYATFENDH